MIDDKINESLKEIERELQSISSARNQVDKTVASYEELKIATEAYAKSLSNVKEDLTKIVKLLQEDYSKIISAFKRQQKDIETASKACLDSLHEASENVEQRVDGWVSSIQKKLLWSLILNGVTIAIIIILNFIK